jgi:hypothetical protein
MRSLPTRVTRNGRRVVARYGGATATYLCTSTRSARRLVHRLEQGYNEKVDFGQNVYVPTIEEE